MDADHAINKLQELDHRRTVIIDNADELTKEYIKENQYEKSNKIK